MSENGRTTISEYLSEFREEMPLWLKEYKEGDEPDVRNAMGGRCVFYPASLYDGHPVQLVNPSHAAHVYVFADYLTSLEKTDNEMARNAFAGYKAIGKKILHSTGDIVGSFSWHLNMEELRQAADRTRDVVRNSNEAYGLFYIYERLPGVGDSHGAERFAVLFLGADGIATYDAMFGNKYYKPFLCLLENYGFGGMYEGFGRDSFMEKIAKRSKVFPEFILFGKSIEEWDGYRKLDLEPSVGGMHNVPRKLWKKI